MTQNTSNSEIIKRLKRASGHLNSVITMLEKNENCLEITQQISAVESAITKAKKTLIHDHIDSCLERSVDGKKAVKAIKEFKEITKYL